MILKRVMPAKKRTTTVKTARPDKGLSLKKPGMKMIDKMMQTTDRAKTPSLYLLSGREIQKRTIKPTRTRRAVDAVATSLSPILVNLLVKTRMLTASQSVIPPGIYLVRILTVKLPRIREWFFSRAKRKDGRPIVKLEIKVIWAGLIG